MDIRVTHNGDVFWGIDNGIGKLLVSALPSVFEPVNKPRPTLPPEEVWRYSVAVTPGGYRALSRQRAHATEYCALRDAEAIAKRWPDCPHAVVEQWLAVPAVECARG